MITDGNDADTVVNFSANDVRTLGGSSTINGSPFQFTGQRYDAESQFHYFKRRYYSMALGRFCGQDPLESDDLSAYEYVKGRASAAIDPYGLAPCDTPFLVKGGPRKIEAQSCEEGDVKIAANMIMQAVFADALIECMRNKFCPYPEQLMPPATRLDNVTCRATIKFKGDREGNVLHVERVFNVTGDLNTTRWWCPTCKDLVELDALEKAKEALKVAQMELVVEQMREGIEMYTFQKMFGTLSQMGGGGGGSGRGKSCCPTNKGGGGAVLPWRVINAATKAAAAAAAVAAIEDRIRNQTNK